MVVFFSQINILIYQDKLTEHGARGAVWPLAWLSFYRARTTSAHRKLLDSEPARAPLSRASAVYSRAINLNFLIRPRAFSRASCATRTNTERSACSSPLLPPSSPRAPRRRASSGRLPTINQWGVRRRRTLREGGGGGWIQRRLPPPLLCGQ